MMVTRRKQNELLSIWVASSTILAFTNAGCDFMRFGTTCEDDLNCPVPDAGGAAGEGPGGSSGGVGGSTTTSAGTGAPTSTTGGAGGTMTGAGGATITGTGGSGGTASTGGSGGSAGTGGSAPLPCDGACGGATPACDRATDTCVECTEDEPCTEGVCDAETHMCVECDDNDDCTEGVCNPVAHLCVECRDDDDCDDPTPRCDMELQFCVECLESTDCMDPQASRCDAGSCSPCATNDDCTHLTGTTVCDTAVGQCVECTGTDYASCGTLEGTPLVCDGLQKSCTTSKQHGADLCNPCVSDAQCKLGQRCVRETFEGTELGYRCFWEREGGNGAPLGCSQAPPYVTTRNDVTSIDGATADVCTLRISTCKAHEDFSNVDCEGSEDVPDASLCGEPDLNDAGCALYDTVGEDNIYRCTVRCGGDDDCPDESFSCNSSSSPRVCFLNQ